MTIEKPRKIYVEATDATTNLNGDFTIRGTWATSPGSIVEKTEYVRGDLAVTQWQTMETAPKDGTVFVAWTGYPLDGEELFLITLSWKDDEWRDRNGYIYEPLFWMNYQGDPE